MVEKDFSMTGPYRESTNKPEPARQPVFCDKCKFKRWNLQECKHPLAIRILKNACRQWKTYGNCNNRNEKNNCKDFVKANWFKRIW